MRSEVRCDCAFESVTVSTSPMSQYDLRAREGLAHMSDWGIDIWLCSARVDFAAMSSFIVSCGCWSNHNNTRISFQQYSLKVQHTDWCSFEWWSSRVKDKGWWKNILLQVKPRHLKFYLMERFRFFLTHDSTCTLKLLLVATIISSLHTGCEEMTTVLFKVQQKLIWSFSRLLDISRGKPSF